jgi:hypothetical protein
MKKSMKEVMDDFINKKLEEFKEFKEENEVCIEPFAFTDDEGNVINYKELVDVMAESVLELDDELDLDLNEEDIVYDETENQLKEIADEIKPIELMLEVNFGERHLIDKVNCNIKEIPLLDTYFITNRDIFIAQVNITDAMENVDDIEITALIKMEEKYALCTMSVGELNEMGLIKIHNNTDDLEMNNVEFRGLTSTLHAEELEELFKDYEFEDEKYTLTTEEIY